MKKIGLIRGWWLTLRRMGLRGLALMAGLQAVVATTIMVATAWRKRHAQFQGFPHATYPEIQVGENRVRLFSYGRDLYDAMLAAIDAAQESIFLETYLWKGDAVGREFKEHLARKAAEGVAVYVIYDHFGNLVVPRSFKIFPSTIHTLPFRGIRRPWHLLDPRRYALEHRKMLVVDGRVAFVGGYNLGSLYAVEWRDTHVRIDGPAAAHLADEFVDFWGHHHPLGERIDLHYPRHFDPLIVLRDNDAMRLTFPIRDMYIAAIDRAEHHIYLSNAYFIPDGFLLGSLKAAARRGVDVQVLLPWISNHTLADWSARGVFAECLQAGIRIFGYKAMIHAKTCTIDGQWSTIGTANLDRLSSLGNYEINVEIYSRAVAQQMEDLFERDKTNAREITEQSWSSRPLRAKVGERILSPLQIFF